MDVLPRNANRRIDFTLLPSSLPPPLLTPFPLLSCHVQGARMVREIFQLARSKKAAIIFFDEVDAVGGQRVDEGAGGDNEVQRTMLELITQLDGFDARGNIKVLMATNRCVVKGAWECPSRGGVL